MAGVGGGSSEDCFTVSRTAKSEGSFRDPPSGVVTHPDGQLHAPHCRAPLARPGIEGDVEHGVAEASDQEIKRGWHQRARRALGRRGW